MMFYNLGDKRFETDFSTVKNSRMLLLCHNRVNMSKIHDFSGGMFSHTQLNAST